jgi:beta-N-acetylhexosaminidase
MSAHLMLPALDEVPATLSRRVLTGILREELRFDGLVVTDAIEMAAIKRTYGLEEGAVRAIAAGADTVCIGGWRDAEAVVERLRDALVAAVRAGRLDEARLRAAAGRARQVAAWAAGFRRTGPGDRAVGVDAARRAIRVNGTVTPLAAPPHVVELSPKVNAQIGPDTRWGLTEALTRLRPGTTGQRLTAARDDVTVPADRPLVIAVRDAHRHPWIGATLRRLLDRRPDATVVELGLPHGDPPPCATYLATFGAAAVSSAAAAAVLTGE